MTKKAVIIPFGVYFYALYPYQDGYTAKRIKMTTTIILDNNTKE
jgi:hypothetical protein